MNEQRKEQFIGSAMPLPDEAATARECFELLRDIEAEWGADVAERSAPYIDQAIEATAVKMRDRFGGDVNQAQVSVGKVLYLYNKWCRKNKIPADASITRSKYVKIAKAATWVLKSPEHLQQVLDYALMPVPVHPTDLYCRGVVWLAYSGLLLEEIADAVSADYDSQIPAVMVRRDGEEHHIKVPEESKMCLTLLSRLDTFMDYGDAMKGPATVQRRDGDKLVRPQVSKRPVQNWESKNKKSFVRNAIRVVQNKISNISITYDTLYKNGFYYRAWRKECELPENKRLGSISGVPNDLVRMNYRIYIDELEMMIDHFMADSEKLADKEKMRRYWRQKIYNEYLLWKWVSGVK